MTLNIKNPEVLRLASEVAVATGETKTEAIRRALAERKARIALSGRTAERGPSRLRRLLEVEIWPLVPEAERGRRWSRAEEEALLGYGEAGA